MATDAARALIESLINGELTATERSEVVRLRFARTFLPLKFTPVTAVASVTADDDTINADDYRVTPFGIERIDGNDWTGSEITVTYTTGWVLDSEPAEVLAALAQADATMGDSSGVTSEKKGDVTVQRDPVEARSAIRRLVSRWVRP